MKSFPVRLNISWLQRCYQQQTLTPHEVIKEILARTERYLEYNIWITPPSWALLHRYLKNLEELDPQECPLWGIPFVIKDNIDLAGVPTTAGCATYAYTPQKSAFVVQKLLKAGAIPVGKTNLDQFATGLVGMRSFYGEVHNSLRPEFISGGSSSGSAVAVSLGLSAFALGTDTAGSGRVPAALNCLIGYKPSLGAWSTQGVVPACASLDAVTVFAGSLKDVEIVNEVVRGFDKKCCWSKEIIKPVKTLPKKICLPKNNLEFFGDFAADYQEKWQQAVYRLKMMGIVVEEIDIELFQRVASLLYDGPWIAERWQDLGEFVQEHLQDVFPVTEKILRSGDMPEYTAAKTFGAMHELQRYKTLVYQLLQDAVLIMPTTGGTFTRNEVRANPIETNAQMGLYTNHCNLLDLCAIAIPENDQDFELPFGITMFARADREGLILKLAEEFLSSQSKDIAVCGLHMKGMPLEYQLTNLGAEYAETCQTTATYKLVWLEDEPARPGLVYTGKGRSIEVDIYHLPIKAWGSFIANIKSPLGIGDIHLADGRIVKGFLCEDYFASRVKDISTFGGFRKFVEQK